MGPSGPRTGCIPETTRAGRGESCRLARPVPSAPSVPITVAALPARSGERDARVRTKPPHRRPCLPVHIPPGPGERDARVRPTPLHRRPCLPVDMLPGPGLAVPPLDPTRRRSTRVEDLAELGLDFVFLHVTSNGQLFHQQSLCRVEHLAFAKRKIFVVFEQAQIAQHFRDLAGVS